MIYPNNLADLIDSFRKLPGIGEKTAERLALSIVDFKQEDVEFFANSLVSCRNKLHRCTVCGHITDKEICDICSDEQRDGKTICVLEDYKSVFAFEKAGNYRGKYHVLNGLISPIDGINPEDINIASLFKRIENEKDVELIIALKSTVEGEATSLYLQKVLEGRGVKISRLSYGIPMGTEIDYLDEMTLDRALEDRKVIS